MADTRMTAGKPTWLAATTAVLAFIACNGSIIILAILSLLGVTVAINTDVQAAVISLFAVLTLIFVSLGYRNHRISGPLILSAVGALIIVGSMYILFNKIAESLGLLALIISAIWNWRESLTSPHPSRPVSRERD